MNENRLHINKSHSIAVIGASGFIGKNLCKFLIEKIDDLRCISRQKCSFKKTKNLTWVKADSGKSKIIKSISGCETVIYLNSYSTPGTSIDNISADAQKNIITTLHFLDMCIIAKIKRIIFISSGGTVYGIPSKIPILESSPTNPIVPYGVAKLTIEKYLDIYLKYQGLDYCILRMSNVYGPLQDSKNGQGVVAEFLSCVTSEKSLQVWGDGSIVRDYIFISDAVEAILSVVEYQGKERIFNIGSGIGHSLMEVISSIEKITKTTVNKVFKSNRDVDVPVNILDCRLAEKELKWKAHTPFIDGLRLTIKSIKSIKK